MTKFYSASVKVAAANISRDAASSHIDCIFRHWMRLLKLFPTWCSNLKVFYSHTWNTTLFALCHLLLWDCAFNYVRQWCQCHSLRIHLSGQIDTFPPPVYIQASHTVAIQQPSVVLPCHNLYTVALQFNNPAALGLPSSLSLLLQQLLLRLTQATTISLRLSPDSRDCKQTYFQQFQTFWENDERL